MSVLEISQLIGLADNRQFLIIGNQPIVNT